MAITKKEWLENVAKRTVKFKEAQDREEGKKVTVKKEK